MADPTYLRHGACTPETCGAWCCRFIGQDTAVVENPRGLSDPDFYRARGARLHHEDGVPVRAFLHVQRFAPCPLLDGEALRCRIYEGRPRTCAEFPSRPEQVEGVNCGFNFTEVT